ncbi:F-box/LRR-repeat protein At3g59200-like [Carex rostrata]
MLSEHQTMKSIDRISSLPDDVLTHVLSFLSAKYAVQTCILSKRWRSTWASVPVLKFDYMDFDCSDGSDDDPEDDIDKEAVKFDRFVNGVLENRGPSHLDTVIYYAEFWLGPHEPMKWLDRAARLMPRVIRILVSGVDQLNIPNSVFSCASLEHLELSVSIDVITTINPQDIVLPSLKILKLHYMRLSDDFMQKLFVRCAALETVKLRYCGLSISDISSNMLRQLDFFCCRFFRHMRISCPSLVSLSIRSFKNSNRIISLENMASLVNAEIRLCGIDREVDVDDLRDSNILSSLSNATNLRLQFHHCPEFEGQLKKDIPQCRTFNNLRSLDVGCWNMTDFDLVAFFLEHSPVLQQLTLRLRSFGYKQEEPRQDADSLFQLEYLETLNIDCWSNDELASTLVNMLGRHVKLIGNINII